MTEDNVTTSSASPSPMSWHAPTMNESDILHLSSLFYSQFLNNKFDVIGLYVPIFLTGLFANIIVIVVVIKDQYMRNVTNYFLVNLSVADLLVTIICMPNAAWRAYSPFFCLGQDACRITVYLQCVSVAASIFTITAMAIDRYLAITRPFQFFSRCFTRKTTVIVILGLWTTSLLLFVPILVVTTTEQMEPILYQNVSIPIDGQTCGEDWSRFYAPHSVDVRLVCGVVWFVFVFVVPGLIMLFAYSMMSRTLFSVVPPFDNNEGICNTQQRDRLIRGRKRVAYILLLLAFVFAGCWLPYHITSLLNDIYASRDSRNFSDFQIYLLLLGHTNSALNPIIYCALSRRFRRSIKDLLCVTINFSRRRHNMQVQWDFFLLPWTRKLARQACHSIAVDTFSGDQPLGIELRQKNGNSGEYFWADSSGSGTQLHYLQRLKSVPTVHNHFTVTLTRLQSSQKTTKTCAV